MLELAIIEDDRFIRESITEYFSDAGAIHCSLAVESVEDFLEKMPLKTPIQALLLDINLPGISGLDALRLIKDKLPDLEIVMLTIHDKPDYIFKALCSGAVGYLLKDTPLDKIEEALLNIHKGGSAMSPSIARKVVEYFSPKEKSPESALTLREQQVVEGLVDGLSYKLIADRYSLSIETVRFHIKNVYKKLHVNSKSEVVSKALKGEI